MKLSHMPPYNIVLGSSFFRQQVRNDLSALSLSFGGRRFLTSGSCFHSTTFFCQIMSSSVNFSSAINRRSSTAFDLVNTSSLVEASHSVSAYFSGSSMLL